MRELKSYPAKQFALWRVIFGLYLAFVLARLIPYGPELLSEQGAFPEPSANFTYGLFPSIFHVLDSSLQVQSLLGILVLLSILFAAGISRRPTALLLWFGWASIYNRNNLMVDPSVHFIGWFLLLSVLVPLGEPTLLRPRAKGGWRMPALLYSGAWIVVGAAYTISGLKKSLSPSWFDGTALYHIYQSPIAYDSIITQSLLSLPMPLLMIQTWVVLIVQITSLPFYLFERTRFFSWSAMVILHFLALPVLDLSPIIICMLILHLFLFDMNWLERYFKRRGRTDRAR